MQGIINATTQSVLTRFLANVFWFLTLVVMLGIAAYEIIIGQPVNAVVLSVLMSGIGMSGGTLTLNHGTTLTPVGIDTTVSSVAKPTPTAPGSLAAGPTAAGPTAAGPTAAGPTAVTVS